MLISVIIPTYNPNIPRLNSCIQGIINQSIINWECIIVNNNSTKPFESEIIKHTQIKIVKQPEQGLTFARLKGIEEAKHNIIIMVDDDNILDSHYLENCLKIFETHPKLGAIGGKSLPLFEKQPPAYLKEFYGLLALRNMGDEIKIESFENKYPKYAPIGAGMAFRKTAIEKYIHKTTAGQFVISDRKGNSLSSSGDNDMVLEILKAGWQIGYFPQLSLQHIIPESRMTVNYLSHLNFGIQKSWIQFLRSHNLSPWKTISPLSVPFRKFKAWFSYKVWQNDINYIKWKGACGMFEGLER